MSMISEDETTKNLPLQQRQQYQIQYHQMINDMTSSGISICAQQGTLNGDTYTRSPWPQTNPRMDGKVQAKDRLQALADQKKTLKEEEQLQHQAAEKRQETLDIKAEQEKKQQEREKRTKIFQAENKHKKEKHAMMQMQMQMDATKQKQEEMKRQLMLERDSDNKNHEYKHIIDHKHNTQQPLSFEQFYRKAYQEGLVEHLRKSSPFAETRAQWTKRLDAQYVTYLQRSEDKQKHGKEYSGKDTSESTKVTKDTSIVRAAEESKQENVELQASIEGIVDEDEDMDHGEQGVDEAEDWVIVH